MSEDTPTLPGWVDARLDEVFAKFPADLEIRPYRDEYADCLARCRPPADPGAGRARCRGELISNLETLGLDRTVLEALNQVLEAVEDELGDNT